MTSFSRILLATERRLTGQWFLVEDLSPTFLNTRNTDETFQQFGKQDYLRHILNSPASMYECSDPQFFDEPRLVLTFLTYLGVTEIARSSRLVLEGKAGKKIPESSKLEFLEKFLANNFALSDAKDNTLEPLNT